MKTVITAVILFAAFFTTASAQQYKPVDEKSEVKFTIKNFGVNTNGSLSGLKGIINFNPDKPSSSQFDVSVDVNTINTNMEKRDNHLKKDEYFDAAKYPVLKFTSTAIEKSGNQYTVKGNLTIKGATRSLSFPFTAEQDGNGLVFEGNFVINRKDFSVGGNSAVLGDNVNISLKVFAAKG